MAEPLRFLYMKESGTGIGCAVIFRDLRKYRIKGEREKVFFKKEKTRADGTSS